MSSLWAKCKPIPNHHCQATPCNAHSQFELQSLTHAHCVFLQTTSEMFVANWQSLATHSTGVVGLFTLNVMLQYLSVSPVPAVWSTKHTWTQLNARELRSMRSSGIAVITVIKSDDLRLV